MLINFATDRLLGLGVLATKLKNDFAASSIGSTGPAGPPGPSGGLISIVATEDIPAFIAVTSQGKVADTSNPSGGVGKVIGLAQAAIATGFSGTVQASGSITNPLWSWSAGDQIFLNGTGLDTLPAATGFVQYVGTAKTATTIVIEMGLPVLL